MPFHPRKPPGCRPLAWERLWEVWKILRVCRLKGGGVHHAMLGIATFTTCPRQLAGPLERLAFQN
jgi:hypothetical protein